MVNCTEFLGTMAGNQHYLIGNDNQLTYGRVYKPFGGSDILRKKLSADDKPFGSHEYKKLGESYSFTPLQFRDGRAFGVESTTKQGGGYFLTVKEYEREDKERFLNCFAYALGHFSEGLERLTGKTINEIQDLVHETIDDVVKKYFVNVSVPSDGDLAVYSVSPGRYIDLKGQRIEGTTHAGIYRATQPNWNSPDGGTVESKWGWLANYHIFKHDVFFIPHFYGDTVKFYSLKDGVNSS